MMQTAMQPIMAHASQLIIGARSAVKYAGPSLELRFDTGSYRMGPIGSQPAASTMSGLVAFTRASGGGRFNSSGFYEFLVNDVPRLDYDPVTLAPRGLLIEEQRTNLVPYSNTAGGTWTGGGDRVLNTPTGMSGVFATGVSLVRNDTVTTYNYYQSLAPTAGTEYTFSIFVRYSDGRDVNSEFGAPSVENSPLNPFSVVVNGNGLAWADVQKEHLGNGLWRIWKTVTPGDSTARGWGLLIRSTHKAGMPTLFGTGYMIEAGAFPTSYIPTVASQVTRSADVASVNTLSPWYNASEGTIVVRWRTEHSASDRYIFSLTDGTSSKDISGRQFTGRVTRSAIVNGGVVQAVGNGKASAPGQIVKSALAYKENDSAWIDQGDIGWTDTSCTIPTVTSLHLGRLFDLLASSFLCGHIESLEYYPRRLTDALLQSLTTP